MLKAVLRFAAIFFMLCLFFRFQNLCKMKIYASTDLCGFPYRMHDRATDPPPPPHIINVPLHSPPHHCLSSCIHVKRATASLIFGAQTKLICVFMIMIHVSLCLYINLSLHLSRGNNNIDKKSVNCGVGNIYIHIYMAHI